MNSTADAVGGTEPLPEYELLTQEDGGRGVRLKKDGTQANLHAMESDHCEVTVEVGGLLEFDIAGDPNENVNSWFVHNVDIWVDRRAPETLENLDLRVAKLQVQPEVEAVLRCLVNEYHTHEGTLAS